MHIELGSLEIILGVQWLITLGDMIVNWETMVMRIKMRDEEIVIKGYSQLTNTMVNVRTLWKAAQTEEKFYWMQIELLTADSENQQLVGDNRIKALLDQFHTIFKMLSTLPPHKGMEHNILLKEGTEPIQVRPYRYRHIQKNEIKRLVQEMLKDGVIQPSSSPYASPILLVRMKDGGFVWITEL